MIEMFPGVLTADDEMLIVGKVGKSFSDNNNEVDCFVWMFLCAAMRDETSAIAWIVCAL